MAMKRAFEFAILMLLLFSITEAVNHKHHHHHHHHHHPSKQHSRHQHPSKQHNRHQHPSKQHSRHRLLPNLLPPKVFDVGHYGAVDDGNTDNSKAFLRAWKDACKFGGGSVVLIPRSIYLLDSVTFVGPCHGPITFEIQGTLKAPTDPQKFFTGTWISFQYINKLTVTGGGSLDGQGHAAWKYNDCRKNPGCRALPATVRFDFITNSEVRQITSINSKNLHFNIFACNEMSITDVKLIAPSNSPNTDGIHIGGSSGIKISNSVISTGDDCIAMVTGSVNIDIFGVTCGPGHGISIGSLGKSQTPEHVTGISVRNCTFIETDNGARIKTWGERSMPSLASNITFQDIVMKNVHNPIVIDQRYCPHSHCTNGDSTVQIQDVVFKNIRGDSRTRVAVNIQCSEILPCRNVQLIDISLVYVRQGRPAKAMCSNVQGSSYGKQIPHGCL